MSVIKDILEITEYSDHTLSLKLASTYAANDTLKFLIHDCDISDFISVKMLSTYLNKPILFSDKNVHNFENSYGWKSGDFGISKKANSIIEFLAPKYYLNDEEGIEKVIREIEDDRYTTTFQSGAKRDVKEGKGRCDLLPASALLRLARHFESGASKYGDRNWEKGIPIRSFVDSGMRHLLKYMDGRNDEDHLCAATWNLLCAMWTEEKYPELFDEWKKEAYIFPDTKLWD